EWRNYYVRRARDYGYRPLAEWFDRADVIDLYGDRCWHCKSAPFEHLDHYPTAVIDGGQHTLANVRPSCLPCNQQSWRTRDYRQ
ncbi:MAG TPA: hypothetical protein VK054_02395, partial [Beutenbergiaceae bacterium]|nr:hypothetical protein [Beutenbergiaceae bacterium]